MGRKTKYSKELKIEVVKRYLNGDSTIELGRLYNIVTQHGMPILRWVRKYKALGYNGLTNTKKGRPCKESTMKKNVAPTQLNESEREELIRLRAEIEYIKAENEVIKKEIALREEKEAARLKAKKQRLLKNLENKDSN